MALLAVVFGLSPWRALTADGMPATARFGAAIVIVAVFVILLAMARERMRDKRAEKADKFRS